MLSSLQGSCVMFWLGIDSPYALHHPQMSPKEEALAIGVEAVSLFSKESCGVNNEKSPTQAGLARTQISISRRKGSHGRLVD